MEKNNLPESVRAKMRKIAAKIKDLKKEKESLLIHYPVNSIVGKDKKNHDELWKNQFDNIP